MVFINSVLLLLVCCGFQCVFSTGILFNVLKNTVKNTRCELHNIGSKIIQHSHHHGDPCAQQETPGNSEYGGQGTNKFGSQNGYQVTETLHEGRPNGYENKPTESLPGGRPNGHGQQQKQTNQNGDCVKDADCPPKKTCSNYKCVDPCQSSCGLNTECTLAYDNLICFCKVGYTGDPYSQCYKQNTGQENVVTGASYGTGNIGSESSTSSYQIPGYPNGQNVISKGPNEGVGVSGQRGEKGDHGVGNGNAQTGNGQYSVVENQSEDTLIMPDDNYLPGIGSTSTQRPSTRKPSRLNKVTLENDPVTMDIDVRAGASRAISPKSSTPKAYARVPSEGGRNNFDANCPKGQYATDDDECVEET